MVGDLDPLAITQDLVTDCSFVASLCIGAALEKRSGNRIITGNIFPQQNGRPVYNPSGAWPEKLRMIVWRRVWLTPDIVVLLLLGILR